MRKRMRKHEQKRAQKQRAACLRPATNYNPTWKQERDSMSRQVMRSRVIIAASR